MEVEAKTNGTNTERTSNTGAVAEPASCGYQLLLSPYASAAGLFTTGTCMHACRSMPNAAVMSASPLL